MPSIIIRTRAALRAAIFTCGCCFLVVGCAVQTTVPLPDQDEVQRVRERFAEFSRQQDSCDGFIADATVRLTAMLQNGGLSGLLLAASPSSMKFAGLNPFGQPVLVLATDGNDFTLINAVEEKAWVGPVTAEKVTRLLPAGLSLGELYDLVIGRLPGSCRQDIEVQRGSEATNYRLTAHCPDRPLGRQVIFEPESMTVSGMELVEAATKDVVVALAYQEWGNGSCRLPTRIMIEENKATGVTAELVLSAVDSTITLIPADFTQKVPDGFERISVK